ncbi:MAG: hypothetical protein ACI4NG_03275 [Candidatus Gallimonas sp.]
MRTVLVFFGGKSNESEISVITGTLAVNLLRAAGYAAYPVLLGGDGKLYFRAKARSVADFRDAPGKGFLAVTLEGRSLVGGRRRRKLLTADCALNCCHGGMGEDGTLAALVRWNGLPLASPDTPASALFMNKEYSQIAARGLGIPVVRSFAVSEREWRERRSDVELRAEAFGYPVIVKPSRLGSSIGITVARGTDELRSAFSLAFRLDTGALVEEYLDGKRDINCAAYGLYGETVVSSCEEVFSRADILTFQEKYEGTDAARASKIPADLPEETASKIRGYTRLIYESFHCRGVVRADFLVSSEGVFFNELNTVPGSLACYLFGESLSSAKELLASVVEERLATAEEEKETIRTGILNNGVFAGAKGCKNRREMV